MGTGIHEFDPPRKPGKLVPNETIAIHSKQTIFYLENHENV